MPQQSERAPLITIDVTTDSSTPKHRQIFDEIRIAILEGRLTPGRRLPSTRTLAKELSVSRNTILSAYDQLLAEGYIEGKVGAGTHVSNILPEDVLAARKTTKQSLSQSSGPGLSRTGKDLLHSHIRPRHEVRGKAFRPGMPEVERFPWNLWSRLTAKLWRNPPRKLLSYGEPGGYMPLRTAVADYLSAVRGLFCEPEQVIITAGAQQALDLVARALLDSGDAVWIENPGYAGIQGVLTAAGAVKVPIPVDEQGLVVEEGIRLNANARMAIVTPSHQYPLGVVMSLSRRLALLDWARRNDAWILEDDYDSEYRYSGRPLSALQGLDQDGRVIYVGTFSKVLFPAIRLGYMVVPHNLADAMQSIRRTLDDQTSIALQPVLSQFIEEGHFAAHIRRMRLLYAERQECLIDHISNYLGDLLEVKPDEAGMHLIAHFGGSKIVDDQEIETAAAAVGLTTYALSHFYSGSTTRSGLVLGYAGVEERDIIKGVEKLAKVMSP